MRVFYFLITALSLTIGGFASPFIDPHTNMTLEVPEGFVLNEEESKFDQDDGIWWYEFSAPNESVLVVEVERYSEYKDLTDHFHRALTDEDEKIIFEGLEFKHLHVNGLEVSKCKVRALVLSETNSEPLYIYDYFFVYDGYGISVGLMKKDSELYDDAKVTTLMKTLLHSISFKD